MGYLVDPSSGPRDFSGQALFSFSLNMGIKRRKKCNYNNDSETPRICLRAGDGLRMPLVELSSLRYGLAVVLGKKT
jgi:hypothetical protein